VKLSVGLPEGMSADSAEAGSIAAKSLQALNHLRSRYQIGEQDSDWNTLKDFVSSSAQGNRATDQPGGTNVVSSITPVSSAASTPSLGIPAFGSLGFDESMKEVHNLDEMDHGYTWHSLLTGLFWIALAYLFIGAAVNYQQGASGWGLVPHHQFWSSYPQLVGDGLRYSKRLLGFEEKSVSDPFMLTGAMPSSLDKRGLGAGAFEAL